MGRILAIDYGQKRVGIAVTDELQIIANGLCTVSAKEIFTFLSTYMVKEKVDVFVVGEAKQMNNTASSASKFIEPFVKKLRELYPDKQIVRIDERFTSQMAFQTMIEAGLHKKARQNKALVDTISATILLQSYLESKDIQLKYSK
ncbi:MAG: Holliday junction resolvase RuvX [Bacteroidales bacterium]|jgi:putative Holliday junction resolvase|nr:Holliday junction resolvase RuvX [Bacteroidales bacterium]